MIEKLQAYPDYKTTGLKWLEALPRAWSVMRAKSVFRVVDERSESGLEERLTVSANHGVIPRRTANVTMFEAKSYVGHKLCWPGDLVVNSLWAWMQGLGVSKHHGLISSAYSVYRPRAAFAGYADYFDYLLRSAAYLWELHTRSKGVWISRLQLSDPSFMDIPILLPPPEEQALIVRFLHHATDKIDRAIRAKRRVIALLNEQKQAIIHRAVTRGLDPNVPLKDSGIPWLGQIPAHWEVRRIKQVTKIVRGRFSHRPRNDPSLYGGPYPFIQTGAVAQSGGEITEFRQTLNDNGLAVSRMFPAGTLVMTIAANIGDVATLTFDACFPDSIVGFAPRAGVARDFLYFVLRDLKQEFLLDAPVNTQGNLNVERIGVKEVPVPQEEEQREIVRYVVDEIYNLDRPIKTMEREVELLREYRTRLIADVVTGKLDVRAVAAALPAEVDPIEPQRALVDEGSADEDDLLEEEAA
jgi:type I restriction enzyme S subunit